MKKFKIIYMDDYNEVRNLDTHDVIFSTKIPEIIKEYFERTAIVSSVIDNVVNIWNSDGSIESVDAYLLDEGECTQEEREVIIEELYVYANK